MCEVSEVDLPGKSFEDLEKLVNFDPEYPYFYILRFNRFVENKKIKDILSQIPYYDHDGRWVFQNYVDRIDEIEVVLESENVRTLIKEKDVREDDLQLLEYGINKAKVLFLEGIKLWTEGEKLDGNSTLPQQSVSFLTTIRAEFLPTRKEKIEEITKAIKLNPYDFRAFNARGTEYSLSDQLILGVLDFRKCVALFPSDPSVISNLCSYHARIGDFDKALENITSCLEFCPNSADFLSKRGSIYYHQGEYQWALNDQTKAIGIDKQHSISYFARGITYKKIDENDAAISDFTRSIIIILFNFSPTTDRILISLCYKKRGKCYIRQERFEQAIMDFTRAKTCDADEAVYYDYLRQRALDKLKKKIFFRK